MSLNQAAESTLESDMLKTMLLKQAQQGQSNTGQPAGSVMTQGTSRIGIRPGLIKREPGQLPQPQPAQPLSQQQVSQSGSPSLPQLQSIANPQTTAQQGQNPMNVLASMAQFNMQRPPMSAGQPQQQMQQGQQQPMTRGSSPQMASGQGMRMPQNLTPQQQAMMIRYQQQMRQQQMQQLQQQQMQKQQMQKQQMQQGTRPQGPHPGQILNRPRMPIIKQEPGSGPQPQQVPQQNVSSVNRGPAPANVRPPTQGPSGVPAPHAGPIRGMPPVLIKQEGVPNSGPQRPFHGMAGGQRFPVQGQMMGNQPRPNQPGQLPGNQGNPQTRMVQPNTIGQGQPVRQVVPNQRRGGRGQVRARMPQPSGLQIAGMPNRQMNPIAMRLGMVQTQMRGKNPNPNLPTSQSQSQSTSFMQMLTDDSDLMNLMSSQSQYTGVGGLGQNTIYTSAGIRSQAPQNTNSGNMSFMQLLLNDSRTPPPDPDQRQNFMVDQQQVPNQMRMPMPTPPMSDPMSGSPSEYGPNQSSRGNMLPVSSGINSIMSPSGMPFQSGVREEQLPPPYPGSSAVPAQRPVGLNQDNSMYPSSSSQAFSGQQAIPQMGQSQMGPNQMQMPGGTNIPFSQHQQQMGSQGLQPYAPQPGFPNQQQGFPNQQVYLNTMGSVPPNVNQQLTYPANLGADPFSPSIIPPNRDISLNPPHDVRMQGVMDRAGEYMDMDNMHEEMVEPIVIAPIDDRIASKMDHCSARQDMMSLQNMVNRLDNQRNSAGLPLNPNVYLPPVASPQSWDPLDNSAENQLPDVQLVSAHGDFYRTINQCVEAPPPPRSNLSAKSHKLLKSMKRLKLVLKKIDLKGRTSVRLGRKKSRHKEKERRKKHRKERRNKKWRHIDRSHVYERRRKKRESISVSSDSETEDSEYERRRRRRRKHAGRHRKRRSLSSDGSYVSEDDLDMNFRPKKRRTRAKKPQYYLGSDDEFEYESSLTGYIYSAAFDMSSTETSLRSKSLSKKDRGESDVEFDPGEFTSLEEEYSSDISSSDSHSSDSDETGSEREKRISKKKQTSLRIAQRFRSSSSDEINQTFFFDSDDEEYRPAAIKRGRKSQSRHGRKRRKSSTDSSDESPKKKKPKKNLSRSKKLLFSSDGEEAEKESDTEKMEKVSSKKEKVASKKEKITSKKEKIDSKSSKKRNTGKSGGKQKMPEKEKSSPSIKEKSSPSIKEKNSPSIKEKKRSSIKLKNSPPIKPKGKTAGITGSRGKPVKADSTKETVQTRVTRRGKALMSEIESQERESSPLLTRRTRSQLRRDSQSQVFADADKSLNVVSTSEEVSAYKKAQNQTKTYDSQVSSTSENKETQFTVHDRDESPKVVTSTSESKKADDETFEKESGCDQERRSSSEEAHVSSVDTTQVQQNKEEDDTETYEVRPEEKISSESVVHTEKESQEKNGEVNNLTESEGDGQIEDKSCELKGSGPEQADSNPVGSKNEVIHNDGKEMLSSSPKENVVGNQDASERKRSEDAELKEGRMAADIREEHGEQTNDSKIAGETGGQISKDLETCGRDNLEVVQKTNENPPAVETTENNTPPCNKDDSTSATDAANDELCSMESSDMVVLSKDDEETAEPVGQETEAQVGSVEDDEPVRSVAGDKQCETVQKDFEPKMIPSISEPCKEENQSQEDIATELEKISDCVTKLEEAADCDSKKDTPNTPEDNECSEAKTS